MHPHIMHRTHQPIINSIHAKVLFLYTLIEIKVGYYV